jgi:hypothetical protein
VRTPPPIVGATVERSKANDDGFHLVEITWVDAFSDSGGWVYLEDYEMEPAVAKTVGYLLPELREGYLSTAGTYLIREDGTAYHDISHIPVGMLVTVKVL